MSYAYDSLESIIRLTLEELGLWSLQATDLLLMVAAHESKLGQYKKQIKGPALGIYQMEPATLNDIYDNFLQYKPALKESIEGISATCGPDLSALQYDPIYSTALARIHFLRHKEPIPVVHDRIGLAKYAKKYWNTERGKATAGDYLKAFEYYVVRD